MWNWIQPLFLVKNFFLLKMFLFELLKYAKMVEEVKMEQTELMILVMEAWMPLLVQVVEGNEPEDFQRVKT